MRKRFAVGVLFATMAACLLGASGASAAVEFGDSCVGNKTAPGNYTLTTLNAPASGLSLTAPSSGVITQVTVRIKESLAFSIPTAIKTLRPGAGNDFTVTGQATVPVSNAVSVANVRLPVLVGERLGLHGAPVTFEGTSSESTSLYCDELGAGSVLGAVAGDIGPGSAATFAPVDDGRIPVSAVIEADVDGDGYGDETQDKCPQSAAFQIACPVVTLDAYSLVGGSAAKILIATSNEAPVKVTGTVSLGKGSKATLSGGTKTVTPGKLVRFTLKFSKALKEKLKGLEPGKKLTLKVTASATNVAGQISTDKLKTKLKGQG